MKRNVLLGTFILLICAVLWLLESPRAATTQESSPPEPAAVVEPEHIPTPASPDDSAAVDAFSAKLHAALNRPHVRADEALLTFATPADLAAFIARADASGLTILGRLDSLQAVRVRVNDYDTLTRELAARAPTGLRISANPVYTEPTPPPAEVRARSGSAPVGEGLLALLGLDPDDASRGRGVTIAILDGGAAPSTAFGGRLSYLDIGYGITGYGDDGAHATSVAALAGGSTPGAPGVASAASLLSVKVSSADGRADAFSLASGVLAALDAGAQVINISLGAYADSPVLALAIERAVAEGVAVVASSGNDQAGQLAWPAAYPGVVSVGATDAMGNQAIFSNSGDSLQLTAPGYAITTVGTGNTLVDFSGTSASAPIVAGSIATLLSADPTLTPLAAADLLATYGNDGGVAGPDRDYGRATINPGWALDRDNPARIDPAITSLGYAAAAGTVTIVVQNRGHDPLSGLALRVTLGGSTTVHPLPLLTTTAVTTTTLNIPAEAWTPDGRTLAIVELQLPSGITDRDTANNRRVALLQLP